MCWLESLETLKKKTIHRYYKYQRKKLNESEKLREKMNHNYDYKNSGIKDHFKEISFFMSPELKYLGINLFKMQKAKR